jgi:hypothetical protein
MSVLQISLNEKNSGRTDAVARRIGKSADDIVNEAVDRYLEEIDAESPGADWKAAMLQAAGMWKDRDDLPDFDAMRRSMDREVWSR